MVVDDKEIDIDKIICFQQKMVIYTKQNISHFSRHSLILSSFYWSSFFVTFINAIPNLISTINSNCKYNFPAM